LEQEVDMIRQDSELFVQNTKTRGRLLTYILGRVHGAEQIEDELHGLECLWHMCVKQTTVYGDGFYLRLL
jgi:hypothetical protein